MKIYTGFRKAPETMAECREMDCSVCLYDNTLCIDINSSGEQSPCPVRSLLMRIEELNHGIYSHPL